MGGVGVVVVDKWERQNVKLDIYDISLSLSSSKTQKCFQRSHWDFALTSFLALVSLTDMIVLNSWPQQGVESCFQKHFVIQLKVN